MTLPLVMPSDRRDVAEEYNARHPGRMGLLFGPICFKNPHGLPFALDNGRFPVWSSGKEWEEPKFWKLLDRAARVGYPPRWLVVPDVVADPQATLKEWDRWVPRLEGYKWPRALAVQDGMTPEWVRGNFHPAPDVIFIGGTTKWKWKYLKVWCKSFPRVHVGRANKERMLWMAHRCGVESSDGTGWWRHNKDGELERYLSRSSKGLGEWDRKGFFW